MLSADRQGWTEVATFLERPDYIRRVGANVIASSRSWTAVCVGVVPEVVLDRALGDGQPMGDRLCGLTSGSCGQYLSLAASPTLSCLALRQLTRRHTTR